jgi:hypothetical protein
VRVVINDQRSLAFLSSCLPFCSHFCIKEMLTLSMKTNWNSNKYLKHILHKLRRTTRSSSRLCHMRQR